MDLAPRRRLQGYLAIVVAAVFFGMWASLGTLAVQRMHPLTATFYVQLLPGLALLPWVRPSHYRSRDRTLTILTGVVGAFLAPILYFSGLQNTTPTNAALLSNTESLFTMTFAFLFLGERLHARGYAALGAIAAGAFLVTTELRFGDVDFARYLVGNLLLVGAAMFWGLVNNAATVLLRRVPILSFMSVQFLVGCAILAPTMLAFGVPFAVPWEDVPLLVFLALTGITLFTILFYYSFRVIGAMRTGAVLSTSSLWGVLIALALFPALRLSAEQVAGGALMIVALLALYLFGEPGKRDAAGETLKPAGSDGPETP